MKKSTTIFDFFKRKVSNDLEANTSGATLPTTNVEENPDVPIEEISTSQLRKILMNLLRKIPMSLLRKILKQNFKRLI